MRPLSGWLAGRRCWLGSNAYARMWCDRSISELRTTPAERSAAEPFSEQSDDGGNAMSLCLCVRVCLTNGCARWTQ
jgi:hypothetical protein